MGKSDTDEYRKTEISDFDGKSMTYVWYVSKISSKTGINAYN